MATASTHRHDVQHRIVGMVDAPGKPHLVGQNGSDHAREQRVVTHAPHRQHLQAKDGARQRCAEDRGKACAQPCHEQDAPVVRCQPENSGQLVGECGAHLDGGSLAAYRGTEPMRHHRAGQHQWHHAQRHHFFRRVDLIEDEVEATIDRLAHLAVEHAHRQAGEWQQPYHPTVGITPGGGMVECKKKKGGGGAGKCGHHTGQGEPHPHAGQQCEGDGWEEFGHWSTRRRNRPDQWGTYTRTPTAPTQVRFCRRHQLHAAAVEEERQLLDRQYSGASGVCWLSFF